MDEACDEGSEVVVLLQALLDTALLQEEVEALHAVQDVDDIVVVVLLEVSQLHSLCEVAHSLKLHMVQFEEVVVFEYLESQELETILRQFALEVECMELDCV